MNFNARYVAVSLLNFFTTVVIGLLGLRFFLRLFGANETVGFVSWVYETSAVLLAPFRGIFPTQVFENRYVLELTTIFAMIMYAILALILYRLIVWVDGPEETVVTKRRR